MRFFQILRKKKQISKIFKFFQTWNTNDPQKSFKLFKKTHQASTRFFQILTKHTQKDIRCPQDSYLILSKKKHQRSPKSIKLFQKQNKKTPGDSEIVSNLFKFFQKWNTNAPEDSFSHSKNKKNHTRRPRDSFKNKTPGPSQKKYIRYPQDSYKFFQRWNTKDSQKSFKLFQKKNTPGVHEIFSNS